MHYVNSFYIALERRLPLLDGSFFLQYSLW